MSKKCLRSLSRESATRSRGLLLPFVSVQPGVAWFWNLCLLAAVVGSVSTFAWGDELPQQIDPPIGLTRLVPAADLWLDLKGKRVIVDGHVVLRQGPLEMFACPKGTKEHESIVAVNCQAKYVHTALLAIGAKQGTPVQFNPEYRPATGSIIKIEIIWRDDSGERQRVAAQQWVKQAKDGQHLGAEWVFAGSGFWTDPTTGTRHYHGDSGDFICVSNFPTATLDLTIPSSKTNDSLLFEAFTERIPEIGTPVRLVLTVKAES